MYDPFLSYLWWAGSLHQSNDSYTNTNSTIQILYWVRGFFVVPGYSFQSSTLCSYLNWHWDKYFSCELRFISSDCRCPRDRCWSLHQLFLVISKAREAKEEQCPQKGFISHNLNIFLKVEQIPIGIIFYSSLTVERAKDDKGKLRYPALEMPKRQKYIPKLDS